MYHGVKPLIHDTCDSNTGTDTSCHIQLPPSRHVTFPCQVTSKYRLQGHDSKVSTRVTIMRPSEKVHSTRRGRKGHLRTKCMYVDKSHRGESKHNTKCLTPVHNIKVLA